MSATPSFLPWQRELAVQWLDHHERFAHAWLLHGLPGIGKRQFALAAAASLLCESRRQGLACGQCGACHWVAGGNHPDLRILRPDSVAIEEGAETIDETGSGSSASRKTQSRDIRIDQLRALGSWFNTATHRAGWRVAVLYPAEALNVVSANALLKLLEEPPEHTVFLVVADAVDRLLPTLVSRCRRLPLAAPPRAESLKWLDAQGLPGGEPWLAAAGGAPLLAWQLAQHGGAPCPEWLDQLLSALAAAQSPQLGGLADSLEGQPAGEWISVLQRVFFDLSLAAAGMPVRYFPGLAAQTTSIVARVSRESLADTCQWLNQQRAIASHPLNAKLFVHSALQRVVLACAPVS